MRVAILSPFRCPVRGRYAAAERCSIRESTQGQVRCSGQYRTSPPFARAISPVVRSSCQRGAGIGPERDRFAEALAILRPLVRDHPDPIDVRFLLGLAASRGSQESVVEDETRLGLLDEAIAAFRSILIRQPGLVRVRLELALAFFLKEEDQLAQRPFRAGAGGPAARGPGGQHQPVFEHHAGPAPLARVFRLLHCPGYQYQRRVGRAVHLYPRPAVPPGGQWAGASSDIGVVGWGGG